MSKLLLDEQPLLILPKLATKIGLNESIVVQQIHYWLMQKQNIREGFYWTYNSYPEWQKQFPFWSESTIKRTITSLESLGILIVGRYNKLKIDKTKWYRIDYKVLSNYDDSEVFDGRVNVTSPSGQNDLFEGSEWSDGEVNMNRPLPETITKTTTKITKDKKDICFDSQNDELPETINITHNNKKITMEFKIVMDYYKQVTGLGTTYKNKGVRSLLDKIYKKGFTTQDIKNVILTKNYDFRRMGYEKNLKTSVIFALSNFERYVSDVETLLEEMNNRNGGNRSEINGRNTQTNTGQAFSIGLARSSDEHQARSKMRNMQ